MTTLPGAWRDRVSAGTGWPGVSIRWLGEMESWICNFYLSAAARKIVWADPSLSKLACCWDVKQIRPWDTQACCWDVKQIRPWDTLACCWDVKQIRPWDTLACCWDVKQIRPWDTLACCWDVKQATYNKQQWHHIACGKHGMRYAWFAVDWGVARSACGVGTVRDEVSRLW